MLRARAAVPRLAARRCVGAPRVRNYATEKDVSAADARPRVAAPRLAADVPTSRGFPKRGSADRGRDDNLFNQFEFEHLDKDSPAKLFHHYQRATVEANEDAIRLAHRMRTDSAEELCKIVDELQAELTAPPSKNLIEQTIDAYSADFALFATPPPVSQNADDVKLQRLSMLTPNPATWGRIAEALAFDPEQYVKEVKATYDLRHNLPALRDHTIAEYTSDRDLTLRFPDAAAMQVSAQAVAIAEKEDKFAEEIAELMAPTSEEALAAKKHILQKKVKRTDEDGEEDGETAAAEEEEEEVIEDEDLTEAAEGADGAAETKATKTAEDVARDNDPKTAKAKEREDHRTSVMNSRLPVEGSLGVFAEGNSVRVDLAMRQQLHALSSASAQADLQASEHLTEGAQLQITNQTIQHLHTLINYESLTAQLNALRSELEDRLSPEAQNQVWAIAENGASDEEMARLEIDRDEDLTDAEHKNLVLEYLNLARDLKEAQNPTRLQELRARLTELQSAPVTSTADSIMRSWATQKVEMTLDDEADAKREVHAESDDALLEEAKAAREKGKSHKNKMKPEPMPSHGERELLKGSGGRVHHHQPHHLPYGDEEDYWPHMKVIEVKPHVNVTKAGRVTTFSSSVLIGNGEGSAGYGYARGKDAKEATDRALRDAYRNVITIERFEDRTIPYPLAATYCRTKVILRGLDNFGGLRCHDDMKDLCDAFGLEDLFVKTYHRRVLAHVYKAIFNALETIKAPELIAKERGKVYFNPSRVNANRSPYGL